MYKYFGYTIAIFFILGSNISADTNYRGQLVNKIIDQLTTFFQPSQLAGFCEVGMGEIVKHSTTDEVVDAIIDAMYNNLTSSQYTKVASTVMQAQQQYGSMEKVNATIQKCVTGAGPIMKEYYPKIWKKIEAVTGNTKKLNAGYKFSVNKCELSLWKQLAAACKSKLTDTEWSKGLKLVNSYLKLSNLGYTA